MKVLPKFVPRDPFYVLVSGGVDSISAAHWLKYSYYKNFKIVHFNHNVQPINVQMEESVRRFCGDHNFEIVTYFNDRYDRFTQADLRKWRLEEMSKLSGNFITGHHLNDAVENYLANCITGTPEYKPIAEHTQFYDFAIYHPFITTTKKDMAAYVDKHDLSQYIVEDPSNANSKYRRNWIRNVIIPELDNRDVGIETVVKRKFYTYD